MKLALFISVSTLLLTSCRQKSLQESIDDVRTEFSEQAEIENEKVLLWETKIDSIIKMSDTNQILAIHYIDSLLKSDTLNTVKSIDLHFLKGSIYYQIDSFNKALEEFSIVEQNDFIDANPKLLAAKAGAHTKLKEYDLALKELRQAADINYGYYWNIGNYFEIREQRDSQ